MAKISSEPTVEPSIEKTSMAAKTATSILAGQQHKWWQNVASFLKRLIRHRSAQIGLFLLAIVIIAAFFAPLIAPYPYDKLATGKRLQPPSAEHLFGTDSLGRDLFSRVVYGAQITLQIGTITLLIAASFGTLIGLISGYFGGWIDTIFMRLIDLLLAFPGIFLALMIVTVLGPSLINGMIAVGVGAVPGFARVVRGTVLSIKAQDYILAAQATGVPQTRILWRTVLPNALPPIIVLSTLTFPAAVLAAAGLSFIGLGAQPPSPDWGVLLVDAQVYIRDAPWLFNFPGLAIFITVMGSNLLGNALRDVLDPRLRRR